MSPQIIANLLVLGLLLALLLQLAERHPESNARLWTLALLLLFGEELAHLVFLGSGPAGLVHRLAHALALDFYLLAGMTFVFAGVRLRMDPRHLALAIAINLPARLVLLTLYGLDLRSSTPFVLTSLAGIVTAGIALHFWIPARKRYIVFMALLWAGYLFSIHAGAFRFATYWILTFPYTLAAFAFLRDLPRSSLGRSALVLGLGSWALCFLTHAATVAHPAILPFADAFWNLQKFVVAIGLLLLMLEEQVARNRELALHDNLTGLPNRRLFDDRLAQALLLGARNGTRTGLFVLDLNGFKQINDTFGHAGGDLALQAIASTLQAALRSSDTLARIGGDEFAVIVTNIRSPETLLHTIARAIPTSIPGLPASAPALSASIGVSLAPDDSTSPETLLRLADERMYLQKTRS